jgi:hypothetical protein
MAHSHTRKLRLPLVVCGALAALTAVSPADAQRPGAETFSGECEMSGVIRHQPPMTNTPALTTFHGRFSGVCSGVLTDRHGRTTTLEDAPARYDGRGAGELSCLGGITTGTGTLVLAGGHQIGFVLTERRVPGVAVVTLDGDAGGSATVVGTVSRDEDLNEINEQCGGPGLRALRGDAHIVSPGIAG